MEENEKFEEFAEALRKYVDKVNKTALAWGKDKVILPEEVETLINELKYYLENQEKIKKEMQETLETYRKLKEDEEMVYEYNTLYLNDELIKEIAHVGNDFWKSICYTYDGSTLTFGIWNMVAKGGPVELVRIAINNRLQFTGKWLLEELVHKVAKTLTLW